MTIAYWCVLIAALLPYLWVGVAKSERGYDNAAPRAYLDARKGFRQRAHWAQLNSYEAFPPFAAAVIIAHLAAAPQHLVDGLAVAFVLARLAYGVAYIGDRPTLRSLVWTVGMGCVIALFVVAA